VSIVSLVVRARNEARHIGRLIDLALAQTQPPDEIVVVDSGSTDGTPDIALSRPGVRLEKIDPGDFTFGRSLNHGIEHAQGDVIVIASAHVYPVYATWLEQLVSALDDPAVALAYGRQCGAPDSRWSETRVLEQWFPAHGADAPPFCNNANAVIRRGDWERDRYDEQLTGCEDIDWARRVTTRGRRVAYVPGAAVVHVHHETTRQVYRRYKREALALAHMYPGLGIRPLHACALTLAQVRADVTDARRTTRGWRAFVDIVGYRAAQYAGAMSLTGRIDMVPAGLAARYFAIDGEPAATEHPIRAAVEVGR
jgi:glycosyltransferase involved in cell wall biosynthesis